MNVSSVCLPTGLRSVLGAGFSRMNDLTIIQTSQVPYLFNFIWQCDLWIIKLNYFQCIKLNVAGEINSL